MFTSICFRQRRQLLEELKTHKRRAALLSGPTMRRPSSIWSSSCRRTCVCSALSDSASDRWRNSRKSCSHKNWKWAGMLTGGSLCLCLIGWCGWCFSFSCHNCGGFTRPVCVGSKKTLKEGVAHTCLCRADVEATSWAADVWLHHINQCCYNITQNPFYKTVYSTGQTFSLPASVPSPPVTQHYFNNKLHLIVYYSGYKVAPSWMDLYHQQHLGELVLLFHEILGGKRTGCKNTQNSFYSIYSIKLNLVKACIYIYICV